MTHTPFCTEVYMFELIELLFSFADQAERAWDGMRRADKVDRQDLVGDLRELYRRARRNGDKALLILTKWSEDADLVLHYWVEAYKP